MDHTFYEVNNRRNERELRILSAALLVGKEPTNEKRINLKVRMKLSGTSNAGSPEWLDNAYIFVAKNHSPVFPPEEFDGFDLEFSVDNLFEPTTLSASGCKIWSFGVKDFGPEENPETVVEFSIRMPFSRPRWNWLGQYGGERDVWVKFTPGELGALKGKDGPDPKKEDDFEHQGDASEEPVAATGTNGKAPGPVAVKTTPKSGPGSLRKYHEEHGSKSKTPAKKATPKKKK